MIFPSRRWHHTCLGFALWYEFSLKSIQITKMLEYVRVVNLFLHLTTKTTARMLYKTTHFWERLSITSYSSLYFVNGWWQLHQKSSPTSWSSIHFMWIEWPDMASALATIIISGTPVVNRLSATDGLCLHVPQPKLHNLLHLLRYTNYSQCAIMSVSDPLAHGKLW